MAESFLKDWNASKSQNNNGAVPFYRPIDLTPEEKEQACKNIGVAGNDAIERLEGEFTDLRGDMAVVEGNVNTALTAVNNAVTAANDAVSAANAALSQVFTVTADVAAISAKADTNSANIASISAQVQTNVTDISNVSAKNAAQDTQISALSGTVNGLTNNVNSVSAKVDTNTSNISTLSAAEANDRTDINTLSGNLNTVSGIATSARQEALEAKNTANATSAFCQTNYQNLTSGWSAMQNDWSAFSAAEDAVITAATAAIPGQVSAEVSGQLSGKQDKLTPGVNIFLTTADVIDVKNLACTAEGNYAVALGDQTSAYGNYSMTVGNRTSAGTYGFAEGSRAVAAGIYSHAEGSATSAIGQASHAEGRGTITDTNYQHVEGQYNAPAFGALHVIGNGTTTAQRSNIVETYTDRVVVNGDLINDTKDQVLTQFMFDNTPLSSRSQTKLILKNGPISATSPISAAKIYNIGNYEYINNTSGVADNTYLINVSGVEIVDWEGTVGSILHGSIGTFRPPTAWPTAYLPANSYNGTTGLSYNSFAADNKIITSIPSGWLNSVSSYVTDSYSLYSVREMFRGCTNLTGDVKPWMDFVLSQSAAGQAGASGRDWYRASIFRGCTGVDNYSTLTADPTYSGFF